MINLKTQISFPATIKSKVLVSLILGLFLSFVIVVLQPFDTNEFESNNRFLLLMGFGFLVSLVSLTLGLFENLWYKRLNKKWSVWNEIISIITFFIFSGSIVYIYNHNIVNGLSYTLQSHIAYYYHIVLAMIPLVGPLLIFLRQKFGESLQIIPFSSVVLTGQNKNEELILDRKNLAYIRSIENYIEVYFSTYENKIKKVTFRQTLLNAHKQVPFLEKSHRSYLVNISHVKSVVGNSQNAKLSLVEGYDEIPLSKSFYKIFADRFKQ